MSRRDPAPLKTPEQRVYDIYIAARQSAALAAGVRIGLFDALADAPRDSAALATRLGLEPRPLESLLRVLLALGLLERRGPAWALAADAAAHLVQGREPYLGGLIDLEIENFLTPEMVLRALRGAGGASVYGERDPWEVHARDPERAEAFTRAMHSISAAPARALARALELPAGARVLDVGGGSGVCALEIALAHPGCTCTVWEIAAVAALARRTLAGTEPERGGRLPVLEGDFWKNPWPDADGQGWDAVLFSQILHDWPPERGRWLLERARDTLAPGGCVVIHEKLAEDDGSGPLANALVDLDMLVWTEGQQYSRARLAALLERAGFAPPRFEPGEGYWTIARAGASARPNRLR